MTQHKIIFAKAQKVNKIDMESVDLMITSPPYPMIEMWDEIFIKQNKKISNAFENKDYFKAYELMHAELDKVWEETFRVLKPGGIACINIGDATRTLDKNFQLFPNHARILQKCLDIGFQNLPNIIWRKQTNAPNKFMGSGMLPPGAYVTLEHEFILIFRKGKKREFKTAEEKQKRAESSYFWEERNLWFSDLWDLKGTKQKLNNKDSRKRSGAFPIQIPYRLINMFSVQNDVILDPFLGTGTTTLAAIALNRNSIGVEIDSNLKATINELLLSKENFLNNIIQERLNNHIEFVKKRKAEKGKDAFKYENSFFQFPVMTKQELKIQFPFVNNIEIQDDGFIVHYGDKSDVIIYPNASLFSDLTDKK